jgi:hypothetical protein
MGDVCGKCHRPAFAPNDQAGLAFTSIEACFWQDGATCMAHAHGYQRGLRAGVELAKAEATARMSCEWNGDEYPEVDWVYVDAALAEKLGGGG